MGEKHYPTKVGHGGFSKQLFLRGFVVFWCFPCPNPFLNVDQRLWLPVFIVDAIPLEVLISDMEAVARWSEELIEAIPILIDYSVDYGAWRNTDWLIFLFFVVSWLNQSDAWSLIIGTNQFWDDWLELLPSFSCTNQVRAQSIRTFYCGFCFEWSALCYWRNQIHKLDQSFWTEIEDKKTKTQQIHVRKADH